MNSFTYKIGTSVLSIALFITCLTSTANAQESYETELNKSISTETADSTENESITSEQADHYDDIFEWLSELETLSDYVDSVESLVESIKSTSISSISDYVDDTEIKISDVKIFRNSSDCREGIQITEGELEDQMIVKVFYDDGKSWVQYTVNPATPNEDISLVSTYASNSYGFTLPLDNMSIPSDLTCLFNCSNVSGCSICLSDGTGTWRSKQHNGIDIGWSGINGTCIRAVRAGTVTKGFDNDGWGNWVKIAHTSTLSTLYAHMQSPSTVSGSVLQGNIIGQVGETGAATAPHLHFEVYLNGIRVDPIGSPNYLSGAVTYKPDSTTSKTFKIVDGPLTIRASASSSSTSYGTLANGTSVTIKDIQIGGNYVFGKIVSGTHNGRWIAIASVTGEIYAVDLTSTWTVVDGSLNVRATASTSATSYGKLVNGTTFKVTDTALYNNYVFGKVTNVSNTSGNTCSSSTADGKWIALSNSSSKYCSTKNY